MTMTKDQKATASSERDALIARLRAYDTHNHRGKYAVLCREAAAMLEADRQEVPKKPTQAMIDAAFIALEWSAGSYRDRHAIARAWTAMLDATTGAPK